MSTNTKNYVPPVMTPVRPFALALPTRSNCRAYPMESHTRPLGRSV